MRLYISVYYTEKTFCNERRRRLLLSKKFEKKNETKKKAEKTPQSFYKYFLSLFVSQISFSFLFGCALLRRRRVVS